jgi:hypothetical protein
VVRTDFAKELIVYAQNLEVSGVQGQFEPGQRVRVGWKPQHTFVIEQPAKAKEMEEQDA